MRVGVVGGGITGLSLLHHLRERGVDATLFEASEAPGGVIRTTERDGRVIEHGPQRLRLSEPVERLVAALGLEEELVVADDDLPLYVYADGALRRVPRSVRGFLRTDLLSIRGKLRVLAEPLTAPGRPDETAAEFFARKFGDEAYERLLGPVFGGMYASDPTRMPVRHSLTTVLGLEDRAGSLLRAALSRLGEETPPPASFVDGLQRLPRALADAHADRVSLDTPVTGIGEDGNGHVLETSEGDQPVDRVVVTVAADAAASLLDRVAPDAAEALAGLTYNPLALVHLRSDADPTGFGYQVSRETALRTLGVTWNASLFGPEASGGERAATGRSGVFTAFLGGMADPDVLDRDDEALGGLAAEEFAEVMDAKADVLNVTRLPRGFPAYDDSWDALDDLVLQPGIELATNYTARMGIPSRVREAGELAERLAREAGQ